MCVTEYNSAKKSAKESKSSGKAKVRQVLVLQLAWSCDRR